jgi:hypothetical protein
VAKLALWDLLFVDKQHTKHLLLKIRWVAEKTRVGHEKTNRTNYVPELDQHYVCWYDKEVAKLKLLYYGYAS